MPADKKGPPGGFALLIGKKSSDSSGDHAGDLGMSGDSSDSSSGMDQEAVETSALKDFSTALKTGDLETAKAALKDFLQACYPQLAEGSPEEEAGESSDQESAEPDSGNPGY